MRRRELIGLGGVTLVALGLGAWFVSSGSSSKAPRGAGVSAPPRSGDAGRSSSHVLPAAGFKVAFFGDQGNTQKSRDVLDMIEAEETDLIIHLGDFDYRDDPAAWKKLMGRAKVPWVAVVGNHDKARWSDYRAIIEGQLRSQPELRCTGPEVGVQQSCTVNGVQIVLSGVGLGGSQISGDADEHAKFINGQLTGSAHVWRLCVWHLNQHDMQLGFKSDEAGWETYRACQAQGAMVLNGHEHSYARTVTLTDIGNEDREHGRGGDWNVIRLARGATYVNVVGTGGLGLRDYVGNLIFVNHDDDTWWASGYAANRSIQSGVRREADNEADKGGAAFIEFHVGGDPYKARGSYKTTGVSSPFVNGNQVLRDEWTIDLDATGMSN